MLFNCRYLVGLPMAQKNANELSKKIMEDVNKFLPSAAIFGFEVSEQRTTAAAAAAVEVHK